MSVLETVTNSPVHLAFATIVLTAIVIVTLKAASTTNKHKLIKNNFMPSGQTAIAGAATTIVWLINKNIIVLTLTLVLAILVGESRVESKERTLSEVIVGAIVGVLMVVIIYGLVLFATKI